MTQESAAEAGEPPADSTPPAPQASGLPPWLPYFLIAVVPAIVVGLLVYALAGGDGGGGSNSAAAVFDGYLRRSPAASESLASYPGEAPPDFPGDFPIIKGAKIVTSFVIGSQQGRTYFLIMNASTSEKEAYEYYLQRLDEEPWQIEFARASDEVTVLGFSRPDNADVQGDISMYHSDLDNKTTLYMTYQDVAKKGNPSADEPFVLSRSRALPPDFPNDIPIYGGKQSESVVTDSYFERNAGSRNFYVSFLTKDSQDDVLGFYRSEFEKRGWTVGDSKTQNRGFTLSIDFSDGSKQEVMGTVTADTFQDDADYTKVNLLLQVSTTRGRGN